ncbi:MAG TPA: PQQ-binding-like beta-propeller repeat protein [Bacteroidales bacterium]|nr:PQQ-binding-like beta-propeller repeat protein [Bacteroidales bacterium]
MKNQDSSGKGSRKSLRILPGIIIVILQWLLWFVLPLVIPDQTATAAGVFGGLVGGLLLAIWWAFFSRTTVKERIISSVLVVLSLLGTTLILDRSIATAMMGMMFITYAVPILSLLFVAWVVITRNITGNARLISMILVIVAGSGFWALLRTDGMTGEARQYFNWRWAKTAEEKMMARSSAGTNSAADDSLFFITEPEWPGFRGHDRNSIVHGVTISADWNQSPPEELWRSPVGPGCSSFAIHGNLLFTQEQRGESEMVSCYDLMSGKPVWNHADNIRFWDSHAGAGPRSTPTLYKGRVYSVGATGMLNVLNEQDGSVVWSRDAGKDSGVKIPVWGFTSSPLVTDSAIYIGISGKMLAYNAKTGDLLWQGEDGGESYCSPQLMNINGNQMIVFNNGAGVFGHSPSDGKMLWSVPISGSRIIQPAFPGKDEILIDMGNIKGLKLVSVKSESGKWNTEELWTTNKLKPYFNDLVIHKDHVYGFDGPVLTCIDIRNGEKKWRGGRFSGEILLLADQDLLIVLTEKGEIVLVNAKPDEYKELAHLKAIEGKTWNHPAIAGNILVVRNAVEMAAFRLAMK